MLVCAISSGRILPAFGSSATAAFIALCICSGSSLAELTNAALESSLAAIAKACTASHGYDPENALDIGEHELGQNEREWRNCVYAGIRRDLEPQSRYPDQFEQIIAQDQRFTVAIVAGEMTRYERFQRNRESKQTIVVNEQLAAKQSAAPAPGDRPPTGGEYTQQKMQQEFMRQKMQETLRANNPRMPRALR